MGKQWLCNFLYRFASVKRYGGEGAEAMMGIFMELLDCASESKFKRKLNSFK